MLTAEVRVIDGDTIILDNKKVLHYPIVEIFSINTPEELIENKKKISLFLKSKLS